MAGVYIKGMEMPPFCHVCPMYRIHHTGFSFCKFNNNAIPIVINGDNLFARPEWCPLMEVPDHGNLIDREELIKIMLNTPIKAVDGVDFDQAWFTRVVDTACQFVDEVERQAAVIPADKEEVDE